jgi:hypothetical protein
MIDEDTLLTAHDRRMIAKARKEYSDGKTKSLAQLKREISYHMLASNF